MCNFQIYSCKYGVDISDLLRRRLSAAGCKFDVLAESEKLIELKISNEDTELLAAAVCELILYDLVQFELADMINELPFALEAKRDILCGAVGYARKAAMRTPVKNALYDYFSGNDTLVAEGFILFRMADTREIWERCIEKATEDMLLLEEQYELAWLICEMADKCSERKKDAVLIIRKDGSCILIDENDTHIEYPDGLSVMNALMSLSPEFINVYDMLGNENNELISSLKGAFPSKVRVFNAAKL